MIRKSKAKLYMIRICMVKFMMTNSKVKSMEFYGKEVYDEEFDGKEVYDEEFYGTEVYDEEF